MSKNCSEEEARKIAANMGDKPAPLILPAALRPVVDLTGLTTSCWRFIGAGLAGSFAVGFDQGAVDVVANWLGIKIDRDLAFDLKIIEAEALHLIGGAT